MLEETSSSDSQEVPRKTNGEVSVDDLTDDQKRALDSMYNWFVNESGSKQVMTVGGYAGTGKTTLIKKLIPMLKDHTSGVVAVCAFTGKAVSVLRKKGVTHARTMHSLMYVLEGKDKKTGKFMWRRVDSLESMGSEVSLVIVDEASMVSGSLNSDLLSFGVPVLYVGDHGQLEPIGDNPGLMMNPEVRLEKIHRQAEGSAIIRFSRDVRTGNAPSQVRRKYRKGSEVQILGYRYLDKVLNEVDAVIVGFNNTRVAMNRRIRELKGFSGDIPMVGERMICLQNNRSKGIFNGQQATVRDVGEKFEVELVDERGKYTQKSDKLGDEKKTIKYEVLKVTLEDDSGRVFEVPIIMDQLNKPKTLQTWETLQTWDFRFTLWDFGYAMTCHKAQGSEWPSVAVKEELWDRWNPKRWRYTAATRASERLFYVG